MKQRTIPQLIAQLGGDTEVARALKIKSDAVKKWRERNSIRVIYWAGLRELARQSSVRLTNDQLVQMHEMVRLDLGGLEK